MLPATGSFCVAISYALSSVSSIFSYFNFKLLFFFFDCYIYSTALYNFYAASVVAKASLRKA